MLVDFAAPPWITPYGVMLTLACIVAWWLARRRAHVIGIDPSHVDLALPLAFVGGAFFAGAMAWLVPQELLLAGDALVAGERRRLYAVAFVAVPVLFAYSRMAGLTFRRLADVVAVPALAFMGIVRIGCFLAGCCFGDVSGNGERLALIADPAVRLQLQTVAALSPDGLPWAVSFPAGSFAHRQHEALGLIGPGATSSLPVHPVQLYETVLILLLIIVLIRLRPALGRPGNEALAALGGYAALAFSLEFLRADNALALGPLTLNQLICLSWLALVALLAGSVPASSRAASH